MSRFEFQGLHGAKVRFGVRANRKLAESAVPFRVVVIITCRDEAHPPSIHLNEEQSAQFLAALESDESFVAKNYYERFESFWSDSDSDQDLLRFRVTVERYGYDILSDADRTFVTETLVEFPAELAADMAADIRWSANPQGPPQSGFWRRNSIAIDLCHFDGRNEEIIHSLDDVDEREAIRIIGNVAHRDRIDLAVEFLQRLHRLGRITLEGARSVPILYELEQPLSATWDELYRWSGLTLARPSFSQTLLESSRADDDYSASHYCECIEDAFEDKLEAIDFAAMGFRDVQGRLRRLTENLNAHFDVLNYPPAESGEIVPNIALEQRFYIPDDPFSSGVRMWYTPTLSYEEARRQLLFAHRVCFEDPLLQIIEPIVACISNRPYELHRPYRVRVEPSDVGDGHLELLRQTLLNTQRLGPLIRAKVVIPHSFRDVDVTDEEWEVDAYPRFPNRKVRLAMEEAAATLGKLLGSGALSKFGFPQEVGDAAASFRARDSSDWFHEFYGVNDRLLRAHPAFGQWLDHLYRYAMYDRYHQFKGLGYCQYFTHEDGYKLVAVMEAADFLQRAMAEEGASSSATAFAKRLRQDDVRLQRISANLRPKMSVLSDSDLIQIRKNEELFERWRELLRTSLPAVESYEAANGSQSADAISAEVADRMNEWNSQRDKAMRSQFLGGAFDVTEGAVVSVITNLILQEATSMPSLAAGAAWTVLKSTHRFLKWRSNEELIKRHFLSVT